MSSRPLILNPRYQRDRGFWLSQTASLATQDPGLPPDFPRSKVYSSRRRSVESEISPGCLAKLDALTGRSPFLTYTVLAAALAVCLQRYSGRRAVAFGSPAYATDPSSPLTNALVIVARVDPRRSFRELMLTVRESLRRAYEHQSYSYEALLAELDLGEARERCPLFSVAVSLDSIHGALPDVRNDVTFLFSRTATGPSERVEYRIEYNPQVFESATIRRLSRQFSTVLRDALDNVDARVEELELVDAEQRRKILEEWSTSDSVPVTFGTIHDQLARVVARAPDTTAVVEGGHSHTFTQLNRRANQLANQLVARGTGVESRVGVLLERSFDAVVAILGILRAGCVHVPFDPSDPSDRLRYLAREADVDVLVTRSSARRNVEIDVRSTLLLDDAGLDARGAGPPETEVEPENLAYVLFTSGSTGRPKGVAMPRRALVNLLEWQACDTCFHERGARTLQLTPLTFDVNLQEILSTLCTGGTLVIASDDARRDERELARLLVDERIERLFVAFVTLQRFADAIDAGCPVAESLREVITAGEQLRTTPALVGAFRKLHRTALRNQYGPTEAHVVTEYALADVPTRWPPLPPIGRPISGVRCFLTSEDQRPVPVGMRAQLLLGGAALARGYLHRPERTAERFVPDALSGRPGSRLYRTGDMCRYLADGNVEFSGRRDEQVKFLGHRIEPGEIETWLARHPTVRETAVRLRRDAGTERLVAYVVHRAGPVPTAESLRGFLRTKLPRWMLPSVFVRLRALPLTASGKVERGKLPAPRKLGRDLEHESEAPRTRIERTLAETWVRVTGVDRVGIRDNFFDLGGHSLLAARVMHEAREALGTDLSLRDLFEAPTIAQLAEKIRHSAHFVTSPIPRLPERELYEVSHAQQRILIVDQSDPDRLAYLQPQTIMIDGPLDAEVLEQAFRALVTRHEILRTSFPFRQGRFWQEVHPAGGFVVEHVRLQREDDPEAALETLAHAERNTPFAIDTPPLIRVKVVRISRQRHALLLTAHHLLVDGWSEEVMFTQLRQLYEACEAGREHRLPEPPVQYRDYAAWHNRQVETGAFDDDRDYFLETLGSRPPPLPLRADRPRPKFFSFKGALVHDSFDEQTHARLNRLCRAEGASLFMVLTSALAVLLHWHGNRDDFVIGTVSSGRKHEDLAAALGFFVTTLALRIRVDPRLTYRELLADVKERILGAIDHQEYPFDRLVQDLDLPTDRSRNPLFDLLLICQNPISKEDAFSPPGLRVHVRPQHVVRSLYDLKIEFIPTATVLRGSVEYNTDLFDRETVERLVANLRTVVERILARPDATLRELEPGEPHTGAKPSQAISDDFEIKL